MANLLNFAGSHQPVLFAEEGTMEECLQDTPIEAALQGGKDFIYKVKLEDGKTMQMVIPMRSVRVGELNPIEVRCTIGDETHAGTMLSMKPGLTKVVHLIQGMDQDRRQDLELFWRTYHKCIQEEASLHLAQHALRAEWFGFQAHADVLITLKRGEAALGVKMVRTLAYHLGLNPDEIRRRGLVLLIQRFPVGSPQGIRRIVLRVNPKLEGRKIYFNAWDLKWLHGGDVDGDTAYLLADEKTTFHLPEGEELDDISDLPDMVVLTKDGPTLRSLLDTHQEILSEMYSRRAIDQILNAKVKELTGPLTWLFHALSRGYAQSKRLKGRDAVEGYIEGFMVFYPLLEAVMDARKTKNKTNEEIAAGAERVRRLALALQHLMDGNDLQANVMSGITAMSCFIPFLGDQKLVKIFETAYAETRNLTRARATVGGQLITGGKKLTGSVDLVLKALRQHGTADEQMLQRIQECVRMDACWSMLKQKDREKEVKPKVGFIRTQSSSFASFKAALEGLTCLGEKIVRNCVVREKAGQTILKFGIKQIWRNDLEDSVVGGWLSGMEMVIPKVEPVGKHGHALLRIHNEHDRLYRPVLGMTRNDEAKFESCYDTLHRKMLMALLEWKQEGRKSYPGVIQKALNGVVLDWLHELQVVRGEVDPMLRCEFETYLPDPVVEGKQRRLVTELWEESEKLMIQLLTDTEAVNARSGMPEGTRYDLYSTSKGSPFSVFARAGKDGRSVYGSFINPMDHLQDPKRSTERRELRDAPRLVNCQEPLVQVEGNPFPEIYKDRTTMAWVVFMDNNYVVQVDDGVKWTFDTLGATLDAVELFRLREEKFKAASDRDRDRILERLDRLHVDPDRITVEETETFAGFLDQGAVYRKEYEIIVAGDDRDEGKVKSCVSALKGVLSMLPCRLEAVMPDGGRQVVHLNWSAMSAEGKALADAAAVMVAGKAGVHSVPKNWDKTEMLPVLEQALEDGGFNKDGTQEIIATYPDGREVSLGFHFVGPLPMFRGPQTELHTANWRLNGDGVLVEPHSMVLAGVSHRKDPKVQAEFTDILRVLKRTKMMVDEYDDRGA